MKKIVCVVLAAAMLLSMSACALAATGLGSVTSVTNTPAGEKNGSVSVNTTMCAVSLDEEGKITSVSFDVVQSAATYDATGAVVGEASVVPQSKKELGEGYGMKPASAIGKEWYEQAEALETWCVGKTVEEVLAMPLTEKGAADDVDLKTGCTIGVSDLLKALESAAAAAK